MDNQAIKHFADQIRYYTLKELNYMGYGHYGGSLSIVETLAVLYGNQLQVSPETKDDLNRDFFVLSKGHAGPALYATLFLKGFITEDWLYTLEPERNELAIASGQEQNTGCRYDNRIVRPRDLFRDRHRLREQTCRTQQLHLLHSRGW